MTPDQVADAYARTLDDTVSLVNKGAFLGNVRSRLVQVGPEDVAQDFQENDRKLIMAAADVLAAGFARFRKNSATVRWQGRDLDIQSVDDTTRRIAGVLVAYECRVAGA